MTNPLVERLQEMRDGGYTADWDFFIATVANHLNDAVALDQNAQLTAQQLRDAERFRALEWADGELVEGPSDNINSFWEYKPAGYDGANFNRYYMGITPRKLHECADYAVIAMRAAQPAESNSQSRSNGTNKLTPLETVQYWATEFPKDPQKLAGGMIIHLLNEYAQLRTAGVTLSNLPNGEGKECASLPYSASFCPNCSERSPELHWAEGNIYCAVCDPQGVSTRSSTVNNAAPDSKPVKLFMLSTLLRKHEMRNVTMKLAQGYRATATESEAVGAYLAKIKQDFPDFDIADYLVVEVPFDHIAHVYGATAQDKP